MMNSTLFIFILIRVKKGGAPISDQEQIIDFIMMVMMMIDFII